MQVIQEKLQMFLSRLSSMKVREKLILSMMLAGLLPLFIVGVIVNDKASDALQSQAYAQLVSLRATKAATIESYFQQIHDQVLTFSEDAMIVQGMREMKAGFHRLPEHAEMLPDTDEERTARVTEYYENHFGKEYIQQNGEAYDVSTLLPDSASTLIAQDLYIAKNKHPLGSKDALDNPNDSSLYSAYHNKYHPVIRNYLKKFGYYDIFLVDPETGHIVYSVFKELDYATSLLTGPYKDTNFADVFRQAKNAKNKDDVFLQDFKPYVPSYNAQASFISSPIFDGNRFNWRADLSNASWQDQ